MSPAGSSGSSLAVLGGALDGKRFVLDGLDREVLVGSDPRCGFVLDLPGVSPLHARVGPAAGGFVVHDAGGPQGVFVNDDRVTGPHPLQHGDILWLGPPGEPGSVMLACQVQPQEAAAVAVEPPAGTGDVGFVLDEPGVAAVPVEPPADLGASEGFVLDDPGVAAAVPVKPPVDPGAGDIGFVLDDPAAVAAVPVEPPAGPGVDEGFVLDEPGAVAAVPVEPRVDPGAGPGFVLDEPPAQPAAATTNDMVFVDDSQGIEMISDEAFVVEPEAAAPAPRPAPVQPAPTSATPAAPVRPRPPQPRPAPPAAQARPTPSVPAAPVRPRSPRPGTGAPAGPRPGAVGTSRPAAPRPAAAKRPPAGPRPARRSASKAPRYLIALLLVGAAGAAGVYFGLPLLSGPALDTATPVRVATGQVVVLAGQRLGNSAHDVKVLFGETAGTVVRATPARLEVKVPELVLAPGEDRPTPVRVEVNGRTSTPLSITLFSAPRVETMTPDVAMPGDEIELAGGGIAAGIVVRFGSQAAEVLEVHPGRVRVRVPEIEGAQAPVTIALGADVSEAVPFHVGRPPLVIGVQPATAEPGTLIEVEGRGFAPGSTAMRVDGREALLVSVTPQQVRAVVPRLATAGSKPVEVEVTGLDEVGRGVLTLAEVPAAVPFRFVAEPFTYGSGDLAFLATDTGLGFVLADAGGRSAAERAVEAQQRLNAASVPLKASLDADLEARGATVGLVGNADALIEFQPEDAAAYNEDWLALGAPAATPDRLAVWSTALLRDLLLALERGEEPRHAKRLAASGGALVDLHQAARREGHFGVPYAIMDGLDADLRSRVAALGLSVPAEVPAQATPAVPAPATPEQPAAPAATPAPEATPEAPALPKLNLDGSWRGHEQVPEGRRRISVSFQDETLTVHTRIEFRQPFAKLTRRKDSVRFSINVARGVRYYHGVWDGDKLSGDVTSDAAGRKPMGRFEIQRR